MIKIEPFNDGQGDQLRKFRDVDASGTSWWWYSLGRNKRSAVVDLHKAEGKDIVRKLATTWADVLVENFKPGTMEKWGLGSADLHRANPDLIYTAVSGYGRTGPYASRPGFASACEAMGGFRYVNGFPDRPSVRQNLSMGDTLAGQSAALGTVLALFARDRKSKPPTSGTQAVRGQVVDAAIYEAVFGLMEGVLPDYSGAGIVRGPSGSTVTGIVPTNTYRTKDGKGIVIGANGDALFKRLMTRMGRPDLADDPRFANNQKRVEHQAFLDATIEEWTKSMTAKEVKQAVDEAQVPNGLIYSIVDICEDPQYKAREQLERVSVPSLPPGRDLLIPAVGPKLDKTPGGTAWPGAKLGQHTRDVVCGVLGYSDSDFARLVQDGVVVDGR